MDTKQGHYTVVRNIFNHTLYVAKTWIHVTGRSKTPINVQKTTLPHRAMSKQKKVSVGPTYLASILTYTVVYKIKRWQHLTMEVITEFRNHFTVHI